MKRIMLIGPSQCGKTSLTQCMRGEALHYQKTQAIVWSPTTIDTPGEYLENRCLYSALLASACEADIIALVLNADAPFYRTNEPTRYWPRYQSRFSQSAAYFSCGELVSSGWCAKSICHQRAGEYWGR